jgi:hypothetical protein
MSSDWIDVDSATRRQIPRGTLVQLSGLRGWWEIYRIQHEESLQKTIVEVRNTLSGKSRTVTADRIKAGVKPARSADRPVRSR